MPFIKLNQPKYLSQGQYLIADTDPDSLYFDVSEVPDILTGGKNLFMLKGNRDLLAPGSVIEIEVTDLNGRPIYHENAIYLEPGTKRRAVAIYVYEHTPQGGGVITITGTAQKRPNGKSVSLELQKTPNVKWQKKVNVLPFNENTTRVILNRTPQIQIKEVIKEYLTPTGGIQSGFQINSAIPAGTGWISLQNNGGLDSTTGESLATIHTTASYFTGNMEGSGIILYNITSDDLNFFNDSDPYITNTILTNQFNTTITEVVSSTEAKISPAWQITVTSTEAPHALFGGGSTDGGSVTYAGAYPDGFDQGPSIVHAFQVETSWVSETANSQSFAKIDIAELDPICGDIKRLAIYKKSQGIQQFDIVADVVLENQEILARDDSQGLNQNLGDFYTQTIIDSYWTSSFGGYDGTDPGFTPFILPDPTHFINGVVISGSEALADATTTTDARENAYAEFRMKPSADWNGDGINTSGVALKANTSYILNMKLASQAIPDGFGDRPIIKIFASGSAIDLPNEDSIMRKFTTLTTGNKLIGGQEGMVGIVPEENSTFHFDVSTAGDMAIIFRVVSGRWWVSNVSLKPASQTGWTPNYTSVEIPVNQIAQQNDIVDFKFELYDNIDNLVHTETTQSLAWSGGNIYINGDNNVLDGVIEVG